MHRRRGCHSHACFSEASIHDGLKESEHEEHWLRVDHVVLCPLSELGEEPEVCRFVPSLGRRGFQNSCMFLPSLLTPKLELAKSPEMFHFPGNNRLSQPPLVDFPTILLPFVQLLLMEAAESPGVPGTVKPNKPFLPCELSVRVFVIATEVELG